MMSCVTFVLNDIYERYIEILNGHNHQAFCH